MRVITGTARGRKLKTPSGLDTRPTTEMVKEAVFSIIQFEIEGRRVLDLFSGSGQMGIEALSRGAQSAVFVDSGELPVRIINENLELTGFLSEARVIQRDAAAFLKLCRETFDIAFVDAPYKQELTQRLLPQLAEHMSDVGVILCETAADEELPEYAGAFRIARVYRYGKTHVTLYRCASLNAD